MAYLINLLHANSMNNMMESNWMNNMINGVSCFQGNFDSPLGILIILFWFIFWISIVIILILLAIYLFKKISSRTIFEKSALDILKERYAKGEISKEEFEQKKADLEK